MAKITYLFRRKNVFYFRFRVPVHHQNLFKTREIVQSLRTENREEATHRALKLAAHVKAFLHDIKAGKASEIIRFDSLASLSNGDNEQVALKPLQTAIEHRETLKVREIFQSLKTENREEATHQALKLAAHYKASLADLRTGKSNAIAFSPTTDSTSYNVVATRSVVYPIPRIDNGEHRRVPANPCGKDYSPSLVPPPSR